MDEILKGKLNDLRQKYLSDTDSQNYIDGHERKIRELINNKSFADNPIFRAIVKDAENKLNDINALLMNDQKMNDSERALLFHEKNVWKFVFDRFGTELYDNALKTLEARIDLELEQ